MGTKPVGWEGTSYASRYASTASGDDVYDIINWKDQSSQGGKNGTKEAVSTDPNKRRLTSRLDVELVTRSS